MTERELYGGFDIGSSASKGVLIDASREVVAANIRRTGVDFQGLSEWLFADLLERAGVARDAIKRVVATGYGRANVPFADVAKTEITCQARACYRFFPRAITIVDVGGQDSKVIGLDARGRRTSFAINRKCAAGTGAFLEEMAARLDVLLDDLDGLAAAAPAPVQLSSYCTVFAKSELLTHLRDGRQVGEIVRGVFDAVVKRIIEMISGAGEVVLTGGVAAHNPLIVARLAETLGREVLVPPEPEMTAAYGAALVARNNEI